MNDELVLCSPIPLEQMASMHLMVSGLLRLPGDATATVQRGMRLVTCAGDVCGMVAALVQDQHGKMTHLLLCRLPVSADYRLIPINQIADISTETVFLTLQTCELDQLAPYQSA